MAIENESNQMVLFLNLSDLLLRNQEVEKIEKNRSFTTTDEGFLELSMVIKRGKENLKADIKVKERLSR